MAELFRYTLAKPARTLYGSIGKKSAPKLENGQMGELKFSGTWGIEKEDLDAIIPLMVNAIKGETGNWTNPGDYFLACMSGVTAAKRIRQAAEFNATKPGISQDAAMKIREKAETRAVMFEKYPGILQASSKFDVELAKLVAGKIVDIANEEHIRAAADKELFYPGSWTVPSVAFKAFRRKTIEAKDGCTAYLQNCLFIRKGEKLGGGSGPSNDQVFGNYAGYSDIDPLAGAPSGDMTGDDDIAF